MGGTIDRGQLKPCCDRVSRINLIPVIIFIHRQYKIAVFRGEGIDMPRLKSQEALYAIGPGTPYKRTAKVGFLNDQPPGRKSPSLWIGFIFPVECFIKEYVTAGFKA